jgi:hypothetical protein
MSTIDVRSSRDCRFDSRVPLCSISTVVLALESYHARPGRIIANHDINNTTEKARPEQPIRRKEEQRQ